MEKEKLHPDSIHPVSKLSTFCRYRRLPCTLAPSLGRFDAFMYLVGTHCHLRSFCSTVSLLVMAMSYSSSSTLLDRIRKLTDYKFTSPMRDIASKSSPSSLPRRLVNFRVAVWYLCCSSLALMTNAVPLAPKHR